MLDPRLIEDISDKLAALLHARPTVDLEKNARALLSGFLGNLDLVTREDFERQTEMLNRTRSKLEELEQRLSALEVRSSA